MRPTFLWIIMNLQEFKEIFKEENIAQRAKENLKLIGGLYSHE